MGLHRSELLRRPGRPDRGHAAQARRREALDRSAPVPARPELLHAAARPRGPAARDLHRLAAQRRPRRLDRRCRCSCCPACSRCSACRSSTPATATRRLRRRRCSRPRSRGHRHRGPGRRPGRPARPAQPGPASSLAVARVRSRSTCSASRSRSSSSPPALVGWVDRPRACPACDPAHGQAAADDGPPPLISDDAAAPDQRPSASAARRAHPGRSGWRLWSAPVVAGRCGRPAQHLRRPGPVLLRDRRHHLRRRLRRAGLRRPAGRRGLRLARARRDGRTGSRWPRPPPAR